MYPEFSDFSNAPATYLYYGEETISANAASYKKAYEKCGVGNRLHITIEKNMMHCYSLVPVFKESKKAYNEQIKLLKASDWIL